MGGRGPSEAAALVPEQVRRGLHLRAGVLHGRGSEGTANAHADRSGGSTREARVCPRPGRLHIAYPCDSQGTSIRSTALRSSLYLFIITVYAQHRALRAESSMQK